MTKDTGNWRQALTSRHGAASVTSRRPVQSTMDRARAERATPRPWYGRLETGVIAVRIGLQIPDFNGAGGAQRLGRQLAAVARTADDAGFDSVGVMDHFFQIGVIGPPEQEWPSAASRACGA